MSELPAILEFDPATLVLTGYARMNGGTVWGDRELAGASARCSSRSDPGLIRR